jgi:hypothetical protein
MLKASKTVALTLLTLSTLEWRFEKRLEEMENTTQRSLQQSSSFVSMRYPCSHVQSYRSRSSSNVGRGSNPQCSQQCDHLLIVARGVGVCMGSISQIPFDRPWLLLVSAFLWSHDATSLQPIGSPQAIGFTHGLDRSAVEEVFCRSYSKSCPARKTSTKSVS